MRSLALTVASLVAVTLGACGTSPRDVLAESVTDAGADATVEAGLDAAVADDADGAIAAPDGGTLGPPCVDDGQCNDEAACTYDSCDTAIGRCVFVPDDSQCQTGDYCSGPGVCVAYHGCEAGDPVTCDDGDDCTIDACVDATRACTHTLRDADQDGDPDAHCDPGHDCDDLDPQVASTLPEVCANGIDDNCNGLVDENPCTSPTNATCATALAITAAGTYTLSTQGAPFTYATSCSVATPASAHQVVALVTVPAGGAQDLDAWATAATGDVAVAIRSTCGSAASEQGCGGGVTDEGRARGRSLSPGTYAVVITTQEETSVTLAVSFLPPTTAPTNDSCAAPLPITPGTPITASIIDDPLLLPSQCAQLVGQLTYSFTLAQAQDVRVYASVTRGDGTPVVGLRDAGCAALTDELTCRASGSLPLFARALPAGTYVVTLGASTTIDATLLVQTSAATTAPPDQTCATAPPITPNVLTPVDLSNNASAIGDMCFPGGPDAAFDLSLATASDILVVGRFPEVESGAVSIDDTPSCAYSTAAPNPYCTVAGTPARVSRRNAPAGDYHVVLADTDGSSDANVTAYVRDTVPPTTVTGGQGCAGAVAIPVTGGFFTGDTSTSTPSFSDSCDSANQSGLGAPDQLLSLVLTSPQHVVFDMSASQYTTILDLREGSTCPGAEVPGDCYVGFGAERSFLDLELAAGQYWVVVDGYDGAAGAWGLDVRVLPPTDAGPNP